MRETGERHGRGQPSAAGALAHSRTTLQELRCFLFRPAPTPAPNVAASTGANPRSPRNLVAVPAHRR
jgi:hypothetical protein